MLSRWLPEVAADIAFVTGISLELDRAFTEHGERPRLLSAGCPAPKGFPGASFPGAGGLTSPTAARSPRPSRARD